MKQEFHPDFISRYKPLFSEEEFSVFLEYCQKPLRKAVRINTLRITEDDFSKRALNNWWLLTKIPYIQHWYFIDRDDKSIPLWKSIEYFSGLFYIQETSSMIPPIVLNPNPWETILDVSAAPWSKTTQMAIMMWNSWLVIWNDIVPTRLKALKTNINYQWVIAAATSKFDWRDFGRYFSETFDKILLDAPCSWEWIMRKDTVKWSIDVINDLSTLQKRLIISALQALKIWWELVYSTCTMTPEEDEVILHYVKQELWDKVDILPWSLEWLESTPWMTSWQWKNLHPDCQYGQKIWPHINDTEWFFIAKIRKNSKIIVDKELEYFSRKREEKVLKWKELKILFSQIEKKFWIKSHIFSDYIIIRKWYKIEIRTKESNSFSSLPNIQNIWIPFWEMQSNIFHFNFYSGQTFWHHASKNTITIQKQEKAESFCRWEDIIIDNSEAENTLNWQVIITYDWLILWTSLLQKWWKIKNQVPREHIKL